MRRRAVITGLGGAAVWTFAARAQQQARVQRVGAVVIKATEAAARIAAFESALQSLGWTKGANLRIDYRLSEANPQSLRATCSEVLALDPQVILVQSTPGTNELLRITRTKPVIFVHVSDPIGSGFVSSLTHPGGNVTGFIDIEASLGGKWLQLLKEVAPSVTRAAMLFNPETAPGRGEFFLAPFKAAGPPLSVTTMPAAVRSLSEIETALAALSSERGAGLVVVPESFTGSHSAEIIALAERFRLPTIYTSRLYAAKGGLLSYGIDSPDLYRRAASYVDRVLKGEKPADLPVQAPTKFQLVINLKTAKALGLTVPLTLLASADEVIE